MKAFLSIWLSVATILGGFEASASSGKPSDQYHFIWEDSFTDEQKEKVIIWIDSVANSVQRTVGQYPFDITFTIFKYANAGEPVPWAHTSRGKDQGVHFYINPNFSLDEFLEDWTAQHEISHLAIPFLGKKHAWFAEGFATFLQYQVMHEMGIYTEDELQAVYDYKFSLKKEALSKNEPMQGLLKKYKSQGAYHLMYWGGVSYFYLVNEKLKKQGSSVTKALQSYLKSSREDDYDLKDVLSSLDKAVEGRPFFEEYWRFKSTTGKEIMEDI